jgi:hypothetical protein
MDVDQTFVFRNTGCQRNKVRNKEFLLIIFTFELLFISCGYFICSDNVTMKAVEEDAKDYDIFTGLTELGECILEWGTCFLLDMILVSLSEFLGLSFSHCEQNRQDCKTTTRNPVN